MVYAFSIFFNFQYLARVNISLHFRSRVAILHKEVSAYFLVSDHVNNIVSHCHSLTQEESSFLKFVPPSNECCSCGGEGKVLGKVVELQEN
jgi:hypothetical protein